MIEIADLTRRATAVKGEKALESALPASDFTCPMALNGSATLPTAVIFTRWGLSLMRRFVLERCEPELLAQRPFTFFQRSLIADAALDRSGFVASAPARVSCFAYPFCALAALLPAATLSESSRSCSVTGTRTLVPANDRVAV